MTVQPTCTKCEDLDTCPLGDDCPVANLCPRCGGGVPNDAHRGEYPGALSRLDNETYICSACGTDEAFFNLRFPGQPLPPLNQTVEEAIYEEKLERETDFQRSNGGLF